MFAVKWKVVVQGRKSHVQAVRGREVLGRIRKMSVIIRRRSKRLLCFRDFTVGVSSIVTLVAGIGVPIAQVRGRRGGIVGSALFIRLMKSIKLIAANFSSVSQPMRVTRVATR